MAAHSDNRVDQFRYFLSQSNDSNTIQWEDKCEGESGNNVESSLLPWPVKKFSSPRKLLKICLQRMSRAVHPLPICLHACPRTNLISIRLWMAIYGYKAQVFPNSKHMRLVWSYLTHPSTTDWGSRPNCVCVCIYVCKYVRACIRYACFPESIAIFYPSSLCYPRLNQPFWLRQGSTMANCSIPQSHSWRFAGGNTARGVVRLCTKFATSTTKFRQTSSNALSDSSKWYIFFKL